LPVLVGLTAIGCSDEDENETCEDVCGNDSYQGCEYSNSEAECLTECREVKQISACAAETQAYLNCAADATFTCEDGVRFPLGVTAFRVIT